MKMIRNGEYDLVNISLIGFDPNTGKSYDDCHAEWKAEMDATLARWNGLRWWQWIENVKCRWQIACLHAKLGMP